jgi:hypothetical protein
MHATERRLCELNYALHGNAAKLVYTLLRTVQPHALYFRVHGKISSMAPQ